MEAKAEGRSSRKLHAVNHRHSSTSLPAIQRLVTSGQPTANISAPRLVNRWQFVPARSASPELNMSESASGSENVSLASSLYQKVKHCLLELQCVYIMDV